MQDKKPDYSFRVVLVGDSGVGKSSLFATYRNLHVVASNEKTQRADFYEARVTRHGSLVSLKIHDTQGNDIVYILFTANCALRQQIHVK